MKKRAMGRDASVLKRVGRERRDKSVREYELVKKAAENSSYKFRTLGGLEKEAKLSASDIERVISSHPDEFVVLHRHGASGQKLITTRDHYKKNATFKEKFLGAVLNRVY